MFTAGFDAEDFLEGTEGMVECSISRAEAKTGERGRRDGFF